MALFRVHKARRRWRTASGARRWTWVLWWFDPPGSDIEKTQTRGRMSERMAERERELWQAELNGLSGAAEPGATRWSDFRDAYLATATVDLKPPSLAIARQTLARFEAAIHPRLLSGVGVREIERYRVERMARVSKATVLKDFATLRAAWSWAKRQEFTQVNPFDRDWFGGRSQREDPDCIAPEALPAFLSALIEHPVWVQASLRLAALWGPRAGELAGLERGDIDFAGGTIRIPVSRRGGRTTKEGRGKVVPVDDETLGLLHELSHRDSPVLWGSRETPFTTARGKGGYTRTLAGICRGILAGLGYHPADDKPLQFLRRTAETRLRAKGVSDWKIGLILGHGTRVGQQHYMGLSPSDVAKQVREEVRSAPPRGGRGALGGHGASSAFDGFEQGQA